eukprot:8474994-Alexandrium_andersonii.AAC.1
MVRGPWLQHPELRGAAHLRGPGLRHAPGGGPRQATDGALHRGRGQSPGACARTVQRRLLRRAA